jgi:hypothetical protein
VLTIACGPSSNTPIDANTPPPDGGTPSDGAAPTGAFAPVFGVTITDPWAATSNPLVAERLAGLIGKRQPTARVVFDEGVDRVFHTYGIDASAYVEPVSIIGANARVMGELLDSLFMPSYSVEQYRARACEYRAELGHLVDVWEVGNEINGEWLGSSATEKMMTAIEVFRSDRATFEGTLCPGFTLRPDERPFTLELTLYYNGTYNGGVASTDNCWAEPDHAMLMWANTTFGDGGPAAALRSSLDSILVSYYEDDCNGIQPAWQPVFDELGVIFPDAALGFGECGTTDAALKPTYVDRYYHGMDSNDASFANMRVDHPHFVGGNFWWYFSDDLDNATVYERFSSALSEPFWNR